MSGLRDEIAMAICMASCGMAAHVSDYMADADAAILALRQWMDAEGLVCVPRDATDKMIDAYWDRCGLKSGSETWDTMIAAAPDVLGKP